MVLCVSAVLVSDSLLTMFFLTFPADTRQYPVFVGHKPGRNTTQRHRLDIQLVMVMNRTLYVAARSVVPLFALSPLPLSEKEEGDIMRFFLFQKG